MRITRRQLRRIIREALSEDRFVNKPMTLQQLVKKHAKAYGGRSINDNIADAMEDYHDKMMGLY